MSSLGAFDLECLTDMLKSADSDQQGHSDGESNSENSASLAGKLESAHIVPTTSKSNAKFTEITKKSSDDGRNFNQINSIWNDNEIKGKETLCNNSGLLGDDSRKFSTYDLHFRQSVTTADAFLQTSNKTPATPSCKALIVEILLQGENNDYVQLDLKSNSVALSSPKYILILPLPQPVDPKVGCAKWFTGEDKLVLTLVLARKLDILNF